MPRSSTPSETDDLLATVKQTLATHDMLSAGDRVLVGVSGGPDSMVLLHLLTRLAPVFKIGLGVAHLNHCLRGAAADAEAELVRESAAALGYPCHTGRARVLKVKQKLRISLEAAARRVRYAFFRKTMIMAGYNKLALGHQMNDNAEQVLMALLRGAGSRGLAGIAPVRENRIVRPLINARRTQIVAFASENNIICAVDESNDDRRFLRNRIRHDLLPLLESQYNPLIDLHLNRLADLMRAEEEWIHALVKAPYEQAVLCRDKGSISLSVDSLRQAPPALGRRLVRMALRDLAGTLRRIGFSHVRSVLCLVTNDGGAKGCHLPGGIRVRKNGNRLMLSIKTGVGRGDTDDAMGSATTTIFGPFPVSVEIQALGIGLRFSSCDPHQLPAWDDTGRNRAYLDMQLLSLPLTVRRCLPGDRFVPLGAGGSQKLKKYFIDHKIPRQTRMRTAVLADQQRIVWLVGQRIDDHVKVTAHTSRVLRVEFFLLDTR